jgi:hypothetical protein
MAGAAIGIGSIYMKKDTSNLIIGLLVGSLLLAVIIKGGWLDDLFESGEIERTAGYGQKSLEPLKKTRISEWQDVTVRVHSIKAHKMARVRAKRAAYRVPKDALRSDCDGFSVVVVVFVIENGEIWIGPEQDFYIETEMGVIGGKMWCCKILWCESLTRKDPSDRWDVGRAMHHVKDAVSAASLFEACYGPDSVVEDAKRSTALRDFLEDFFDPSPNGGVEKAPTVKVSAGILRLDCKSWHHNTASAWIEIKSRKVMKTIMNGKQVYPQVYPQ